MTDSYFKVATHLRSQEDRFNKKAEDRFAPIAGVFPFDSRDRTSSEKAHDAALAVKSEHPRTVLSLWRPPMSSGPWDSAERIGELGKAPAIARGEA